ncbi:MAG: hypothetical protein PWP11_1194 [Thauera sp.]|nr:integrase family protein [Thauera sp.]MDI3489917.1 hypothetical protein [Thauera sp.]
MPLTETQIKRMLPPEKERLIGDQHGLYLRCYPTGRKTWLFRTRVGGSWKTRNLGDYPAVPLTAARQKAATLVGKVLAETVTFSQLLDTWYQARIEPRYKKVKNVQTYVDRGKQWLGAEPLHKLGTKQLVDKLSEYAAVYPVAANRCLGAWRLALDYAVERGYIERNPLDRTTARAVGGEEKTRDRVLTDDEIRALWADTHTHAPLLRFILLTGLRIREAQTAHHDRVDGDVLHIVENKSDRPHWVHITALARDQTHPAGWLFDARGQNAVQARLKRYGITWTPHDLRRTFATRVAGLGVAPHVVEKLLNHSLGGVLAVYNRHDYGPERIAATKAWADEIKRIVNV